MKTIRYTGLTLFLFSFGLFLALFFGSSYKLTDGVLAQTVKEEHLHPIQSQFSEIIGKEYALSIPFANTIKSGINEINQRARDAQKWDEVIYDDYTSYLVRNAT